MLDYWHLIKKEPQRFEGVFDRIIEVIVNVGQWIVPVREFLKQLALLLPQTDKTTP